MVAPAPANECSHGNRTVSILHEDGADCLNRWVGESEWTRAGDCQPCAAPCWLIVDRRRSSALAVTLHFIYSFKNIELLEVVHFENV